MKRSEIYKAIDEERRHQDLKWNDRNTKSEIPDNEKSIAEWIIYMEAHLNKSKEMVYKLDKNAALAELRKVVALGVRAMEIHGCPSRNPLPNNQIKIDFKDAATLEEDELTEKEDIEEYMNAVGRKIEQKCDEDSREINFLDRLWYGKRRP